MHISRLFAGLAAVTLLSACGDGGTPSPARTTPTGAPPRTRVTAAAAVDAASLFVQVSQCFRAHGHADFPDPVQAQDGSWGFPVTADRVPVPAECIDLVRRSKEVSPGAPKVSAAAVDPARGRAFAACMRDNGVADWPDPNADGTFTVPARLADPGAEHLWKPAASGPCKQFQPDGGPDIVMAAPR